MKPLAAPANHGVLGQQEKQSVSIHHCRHHGLPGWGAGSVGSWQGVLFHGVLLFSRGSSVLEGSDIGCCSEEGGREEGREGELQLTRSSDFL